MPEGAELTRERARAFDDGTSSTDSRETFSLKVIRRKQSRPSSEQPNGRASPKLGDELKPAARKMKATSASQRPDFLQKKLEWSGAGWKTSADADGRGMKSENGTFSSPKKAAQNTCAGARLIGHENGEQRLLVTDHSAPREKVIKTKKKRRAESDHVPFDDGRKPPKKKLRTDQSTSEKIAQPAATSGKGLKNRLQSASDEIAKHRQIGSGKKAVAAQGNEVHRRTRSPSNISSKRQPEESVKKRRRDGSDLTKARQNHVPMKKHEGDVNSARGISEERSKVIAVEGHKDVGMRGRDNAKHSPDAEGCRRSAAKTRRDAADRLTVTGNKCVYCQEQGDDPVSVGNLRSIGSDSSGGEMFVHVNCAVWSPEVYVDENDILRNVRASLTRAQKMTCIFCQNPGASLSCMFQQDACCQSFHFECGLLGGCLFTSTFETYCPVHRTSMEAQGKGAFLITPGSMSKARLSKQPKCSYCDGPNFDMGLGPLLICHACKSVHHAQCLDPPLKTTRVIPLWTCKDCDRCGICAKKGTKKDSLWCRACQRKFHRTCLESSGVQKLPERGKDASTWTCELCAACDHCERSKADIGGDLIGGCCKECLSLYEAGDFCPICDKVYKEEDSNMVSCDSCEKWVHDTCEGLSEDQLSAIGKSSDPWSCKVCRMLGGAKARKHLLQRQKNVRNRTARILLPELQHDAHAEKAKEKKKEKKAKKPPAEAANSEGNEKKVKKKKVPTSHQSSGSKETGEGREKSDSDCDEKELGVSDLMEIHVKSSGYISRLGIGFDLCVVCGAGGTSSVMRFCVTCGEGYHNHCLAQEIVVTAERMDYSKLSKSNMLRYAAGVLEAKASPAWRCPNCVVCDMCGEGDNHTNLIVCDYCDRGFHTTCLVPQLEVVPKGSWMCSECRTCDVCRKAPRVAVVHGMSCCERCKEFASDWKPCTSCGRATNGKSVVQCSACSCLVHEECDEKEQRVYLQAEPSWKYHCPQCRSERTNNEMVVSTLISSGTVTAYRGKSKLATFRGSANPSNGNPWKSFDCGADRAFEPIVRDQQTVANGKAISTPDVFGHGEDENLPFNEAFLQAKSGKASDAPKALELWENESSGPIAVPSSEKYAQPCTAGCGTWSLSRPNKEQAFAERQLFHLESLSKPRTSSSESAQLVKAENFLHADARDASDDDEDWTSDSSEEVQLEPITSWDIELKPERLCEFCHKSGDGDVCGRLIPYDGGHWVHVLCALWSSEVREKKCKGLLLLHVSAAVARGRLCKCTGCGRYGATVGCVSTRCSANYHLPCALAAKCQLTRAEKDVRGLRCHAHMERSGGPGENDAAHLINLDVRIQSDQETTPSATRDRSRESNQALVRVGSISLVDSGQIVPDPSCFHDKDALYPVGYRACRQFFSLLHPRSRCVYFLSIIGDQTTGPLFCIRCQDDPEWSVVRSTPEAAWRKVLERVVAIRITSDDVNNTWYRHERVHCTGSQARDVFGLSVPAIAAILERQPESYRCTNFKFLYHANEEMDSFPVANSSGCARSEGIVRRHVAQKNHLQALEQTEEDAVLRRNGKGRLSILPYSVLHRKMLRMWRSRVVLKLSSIQGLGLFAVETYQPGEIVLEYCGELIRPELSDKREAYYDSRGIGCYMFRLQANTIIDATLTGNLARFINHSCDPNCFSRIVTVDNGRKAVVIVTKRPVAVDEEFTYDYQFNVDEEGAKKLPCNCGAYNCRRSLN